MAASRGAASSAFVFFTLSGDYHCPNQNHFGKLISLLLSQSRLHWELTLKMAVGYSHVCRDCTCLMMKIHFSTLAAEVSVFGWTGDILGKRMSCNNAGMEKPVRKPHSLPFVPSAHAVVDVKYSSSVTDTSLGKTCVEWTAKGVLADHWTWGQSTRKSRVDWCFMTRE